MTFEYLRGKKVLFITTKNLDYIRNHQEIFLLKSVAHSLDIIGSERKGYLRRMLTVCGKLLMTNTQKYDAVFIGFAPQLVVPFWKRKWKSCDLTIDFFISLYDTLVNDRKRIKKNSLFAKLLMNLDKKTIKAADHVVVDTRSHGDFFREVFGMKEKQQQVLYLEADTSIYYPREVGRPAELMGKFLVIYFGSVLPLQGVEIVLDAVRQLSSQKDIHFILIGPIKQKLSETKTDNVWYYPWLTQEELAEKIAMADLCLAGHFNGEILKARRTIPGKAYIYKAMEKPMILGDNPANRELYDESIKGIHFVEMGNSKALAKKIKEIHRSEFQKSSLSEEQLIQENKEH